MYPEPYSIYLRGDYRLTGIEVSEFLVVRVAPEKAPV